MQTNDKKIADELKAGSNGKKAGAKDAAKAGANKIAQFVDHVSDRASDQVADAITAATVRKAMQKVGVGGKLTQTAMNEFTAAWEQVLVIELPELTGAVDSPKFLLPFNGEADGGKSRC